MGSMNFHVPGTLPAGGALALERAQFVGGYDRSPFPTQVESRPGLLTLVKAQNESCCVSVPWPLEGLGFPVSTSATLREKAEPYQLLVELARGKLNQLRNAVAELKMQGLEPSAEVRAESREAVRLLASAALRQTPGEGDADATAALAHGFAGSQALLTQFSATALDLRTQGGHRIPLRWGCRLASVPTPEQSAAFVATFSHAVLVPDWAALEVASTKYDWAKLDDLVDWAHAHGYQPTIGPLIDFGEPLPAWLDGWEGELPSLSAFFCDFVESVVHRYGSKIKNWILCSGFNHMTRYAVSEDDRLRLVGRLLELARTLDPDAKWTIGLAQPWGDYLGTGDHTYSPLVFADTLLRSGLPIGGFELELFAGEDERASQMRDGLDTVRLLDLFGLLGIPIDVVARHPGRGPANSSTVLSKCWQGRDDETAQAAWGEWVASLALCYAHIRSFSWGDWADESNAAFGLVAPDGRAKPLLKVLAAKRGHCAG